MPRFVPDSSWSVIHSRMWASLSHFQHASACHSYLLWYAVCVVAEKANSKQSKLAKQTKQQTVLKSSKGTCQWQRSAKRHCWTTGLQERCTLSEEKTIFRMQNLNIDDITVAESIWSKSQQQQQTTKKQTSAKASTFNIYILFMY